MNDCERESCECRYTFSLSADATVYHRAIWTYAEPWPDKGGWIDNSTGMSMARFEFKIPMVVR